MFFTVCGECIKGSRVRVVDDLLCIIVVTAIIASVKFLYLMLRRSVFARWKVWQRNLVVCLLNH